MPAPPAATSPAPSAHATRISRQAIFDRDLDVYGYELLYRGPGERGGDHASSVTVLDTFLDLGMERVVGRHRAFINLTRRFVTDWPLLPMEPAQVVLEILEDVPVDDALLAGLTHLRARGFGLALDDYRFEAHWEPVLPYVDMVKVDVPDAGWPAIERHSASLRERGLLLLAEKVETHQAFRRLYDLGFDYFQGYFFARPQRISERRVRENRMVVLRLLGRLNDPNAGVDELEGLITQDAGLSYKILRYINSAAVGLARPVESIRQAVILMGLARIRGWASLLALSGTDDKPQELLRLGLVRAYACEALARLGRTAAPDIAYTVGLFSVLDALLDLPMPQLLQELPLPGDVAAALADHTGPYGAVLACTLALERSAPPPAGPHPVPPDQAARAFVDSMERADRAVNSLQDP